jgi:hypothetical protein
LGGVGFSLRRCSVVAFGVVSVVSVRGLRAGDQSVVYVGRRCAGWEGSVLGNPFRLGPGEAAGAASARFRVWLRGVVAAGLAGSALSGGEAAAWAELVRLAGLVRAGQSLRLACWCGPAGGTCHAFVVREAVVWLAGRG